MSLGPINLFQLSEITIKDLVLDDLAGYTAMFEEMDASIIDRQATIVLYELYRNLVNVPPEDEMTINIKRWIAGHTVLRLLPPLRTYIAKNEIKGDTSQEGSITHYDQLENLNEIERIVQFRLQELRNLIQLELEADYAVGGPLYDVPATRNASPTTGLVTLDPWKIGAEMFKN